MKQPIKLGFADYTTLVFIPDAASTDGSGKTGLVAANLTVSHTRVETDNDVVVTDVTSSLNNLAALTTAHTDWGLLEVSNTLAPGLYRLDIGDAVFAAGAWTAVVYVMVTTSAASASPMEFLLVAYDINDTVRLGLTALPNAAANAAGGLPISAAGGLNLDAQIGTDIDAILADTGTDGVAIATGAITAAKFGAGAIDAAALAADAVDEILNDAIGDGTLTVREALRILVASQAGKVSGAATTTVTIRNVADTADVITATVDADGNRTALTVVP